MAQKYSYHLLITSPGGGETRDLTALVQSVTWAGDIRQTAREPTRRTGGRCSSARCFNAPPTVRAFWSVCPPWTGGGSW